jgi:hypothetical protein
VYAAGYLMISELGPSRSGERGGRHRYDDCAAIDVRVLHRHAQRGQAGACASWRWHGGGRPLCSVDVWIHADRLILTDVTHPRQPYTEVIALTRTPCHYGGTRPWFCCPGCHRRCAKLYLHRDRFRCRTCHGLDYRSQLEASAERPRLSRQCTSAANVACGHPSPTRRVQSISRHPNAVRKRLGIEFLCLANIALRPEGSPCR